MRVLVIKRQKDYQKNRQISGNIQKGFSIYARIHL